MCSGARFLAWQWRLKTTQAMEMKGSKTSNCAFPGYRQGIVLYTHDLRGGSKCYKCCIAIMLADECALKSKTPTLMPCPERPQKPVAGCKTERRSRTSVGNASLLHAVDLVLFHPRQSVWTVPTLPGTTTICPILSEGLSCVQSS